MKMDEELDPRIYFAAERTLLAWIRTGIGVIGLGFIVARFGLFLHLIRGESAEEYQPSISAWIGVFAICLGAIGMLAALHQFRNYTRTLPGGDSPEGYSIGGVIGYCLAIVAAAIALAFYLVFELR